MWNADSSPQSRVGCIFTLWTGVVCQTYSSIECQPGCNLELIFKKSCFDICPRNCSLAWECIRRAGCGINHLIKLIISLTVNLHPNAEYMLLFVDANGRNPAHKVGAP